ncbi:hypothetical protein [Mesorhizobium sp. B4-1-4]|uniref:hypothetical protein n=1 Tax=Mesorhizobium sp. B4-1-4 TaxID=2589888 RepID=UPI00112975DD|nr:hypothetical protein [Mesorhizobium sp. B4-1-4]UCI29438.1 hypothetical protein FJW03_16400 [Mesorhizobium sp. B4-1-4]
MWLRVDENTDVLTSLSECLHCVRRASDEPGLWKWAIHSLHSALQGAMVCHLSGTAQLGAQSDRCVRKILDWHERDRRGEVERVLVREDEWGPIFQPKRQEDAFPEERLASAPDLFERLHNDVKRVEGGAGALLALLPHHHRSFGKLNTLRNDFVHFTPKGWSIELAGLPRICADVTSVIDIIAADPWPFRHMHERDRGRLATLLGELRMALQTLGNADQPA